jgi:ribosomal protein S18 acetylase RimI-like enzyme
MAKYLTFHEGIGELQVVTQLKNAGAMKFYQRVGFQIEAITPIYHLWPKKI